MIVWFLIGLVILFIFVIAKMGKYKTLDPKNPPKNPNFERPTQVELHVYLHSEDTMGKEKLDENKL